MEWEKLGLWQFYGNSETPASVAVIVHTMDSRRANGGKVNELQVKFACFHLKEGSSSLRVPLVSLSSDMQRAKVSRVTCPSINGRGIRYAGCDSADGACDR